MLAYKHEMHLFGGSILGCSLEKKSSDLRCTLLKPKTTKEHLRLKDWSIGLLVQSIGVKPK